MITLHTACSYVLLYINFLIFECQSVLVMMWIDLEAGIRRPKPSVSLQLIRSLQSWLLAPVSLAQKLVTKLWQTHSKTLQELETESLREEERIGLRCRMV